MTSSRRRAARRRRGHTVASPARRPRRAWRSPTSTRRSARSSASRRTSATRTRASSTRSRRRTSSRTIMSRGIPSAPPSIRVPPTRSTRPIPIDWSRRRRRYAMRRAAGRRCGPDGAGRRPALPEKTEKDDDYKANMRPWGPSSRGACARTTPSTSMRSTLLGKIAIGPRTAVREGTRCVPGPERIKRTLPQ